MKNQTALLLIAHGSRKREANEDLEYLAAQIRMRGGYSFVQASYLELAEPSIVAGGTLCVHQCASRVVMLPYFLSAGVHVQDDMQDARKQLQALFPEVEFVLAEPLGRHPLLVEIVLERAEQAGE